MYTLYVLYIQWNPLQTSWAHNVLIDLIPHRQGLCCISYTGLQCHTTEFSLGKFRSLWKSSHSATFLLCWQKCNFDLSQGFVWRKPAVTFHSSCIWHSAGDKRNSDVAKCFAWKGLHCTCRCDVLLFACLMPCFCLFLLFFLPWLRPVCSLRFRGRLRGQCKLSSQIPPLFPLKSQLSVNHS